MGFFLLLQKCSQGGKKKPNLPYKIKVTANYGEGQVSKVFEQKVTDIIIQEYWDHYPYDNSQGRRLDSSIFPFRGDIVTTEPQDPYYPDARSWNCVNGGNRQNCVEYASANYFASRLSVGNPLKIAATVRTEFNEYMRTAVSGSYTRYQLDYCEIVANVANHGLPTQTLGPVFVDYCADGIPIDTGPPIPGSDVTPIITSSWRNPERNEAVGGAISSNHQFGGANDLFLVDTASTWGGRPRNNVHLCGLAFVGTSINATEAFVEAGPGNIVADFTNKSADLTERVDTVRECFEVVQNEVPDHIHIAK